MICCVRFFDVGKYILFLFQKWIFYSGKKVKNGLDECVRKYEYWVRIDLIKIYEQR